MPTSSGAHSTPSAVRKLPLVGVSVSEPTGPSVDMHPAETGPVPPEQLPLLGALPDPAPMQSLSSPLEVCEARIRELESLFASMSSYMEALESRVSSLEPLLPQAQRAELQVVEALAMANAIEARVSLLEQVTARAHFAHFDPHLGSAAAPEEEVTGRQGRRNRKSGQESLEFIPKDPTADPQGQRESICTGKQDNNCREKPDISYPISDEEDSDYSDKSVNWP
jgi:hypothetical protein